MKMEVLTRNQFQTQFEVIGSSKVKDWTSPLTPPPAPAITTTTTSSSQHTATTITPSIGNKISSKSTNNHHYQSNSNTARNNNNNNNISRSTSHHHHQLIEQQNSSPTIGTTTTTTVITTSSLLNNDSTVQALSLRLQNELRMAKSRHLACTEVLLPSDLLPRIASEMVEMSEKEPCGIRGCSLFIEFEDEPGNTRRIASLQVDANTVSTFELYLKLKHDRSGWTSILPQFLKNLTRGSTIMISPDFTLTKTKLYRSFSE